MRIQSLKRFKKVFDRGSVCVCGQRGRGKDLLMGNVAVRKGVYYSNVPYGGSHRYFDFSALDINNDYTDLVSGSVKPYTYPYELGRDIFISDIGVYFPSQYCNELNKKYPRLPYFLALSRQLSKGGSVHLNCQNLNRCWDKYRELSDCYIMCLGVFRPLLKFGIVIQAVRTYELYDACLRRVPPFRLPKPKFTAPKEVKQNYAIERARYDQLNGKVRDYILIYRNKAKYDTYYFKTLLEGSKCDTTDANRTSCFHRAYNALVSTFSRIRIRVRCKKLDKLLARLRHSHK